MGQFDMASQIPSGGRSFFAGTDTVPSAINRISMYIDISKWNIDNDDVGG